MSILRNPMFNTSHCPWLNAFTRDYTYSRSYIPQVLKISFYRVAEIYHYGPEPEILLRMSILK